MAEPDFWQNRKQAEKKSRQMARRKEDITRWGKIERSINNVLEMVELDTK